MNKSNNALFAQGIKVIKQIESHHFEAYFVGGCVRDHLLRVPVTDIDIATSATPEQLQNIFPHLIPIGIDHGTVLVREKKVSVEITTFRTDASRTEALYPNQNETVRSLEEDVKRRDFTMNALAMDRHFQLVDYTNGKEDLESGLIRAVDDPQQRLQEDPLRILRGIRFVSQLGFTIEKSTLQAMKQSAHLLETVATERLHSECEQLFAQVHVKEALEQLLFIQADRYLPIFKHERTLIPAVLETVQPLKSFSEVIAVMHLLAPVHSVNNWVNGWKCSNQTKKEAKMLINAFRNSVKNDAIQPYMIYKIDGLLESFFRVYHVMQSDKQLDIQSLYEVQKDLPITNRRELTVNGSDLLSLFPTKKQGKWIHETLERIEYMVVMRDLPNEKQKLKEWIMCNQQDFN